MYTFAVILGYDPKVFGVAAAAAALPPSPGRKTLRAIVEPVTTKNRHISNDFIHIIITLVKTVECNLILIGQKEKKFLKFLPFFGRL